MTTEEWYEQLFYRLEHSKFRSGFHLKKKDIDYINEKGLDTIREHARDFIAKREAPAVIPNDGIRKWHKMRPGRELSPVQQEYLVDVIMTWIQKEMEAYKNVHKK